MISLRTILATFAVLLASLVPATAATASSSSASTGDQATVRGSVGAAPSTRADGTAILPLTQSDRSTLGSSLPKRATGWGVHPNGSIHLVNKNGQDLKRNAAFWSKTWKYVKCGAAITWVIGSTVFIGAKIVKFKALIKELGGIKDTAKLLVKATSKEEKIDALSGAGKSFASEILGIGAIATQCG